MSQKKRNKSQPDKAAAPESSWGALVLVSLFLCRFLVPTEAVDQGHTLWIAFLWFGFAALTFILRWRDLQAVQLRWSWLDLAVAAMVLGHIFSGIMIFTGAGNQRSALNMMWEWASLGVLWMMLKLHLQNRQTRPLLLNAIVVMVVALSVLGIWQHYVWFPQQAQAYEALVDYTQRTQSGKKLSSEERQEFQKLTDEYGTEVATLDASARMSMLSRVRDSVEPIGRFALTNSFATLLIAALFLLANPLLFAQDKANLRTAIVLGSALIFVLFCLILTKSRSAWAGAIAGAVLLILLQWKRSRVVFTFPRWTVPSGMLLLAILIGWATMTGGLDPQVISEAPKSLQYRLEYWTSTAQLLRDNPVFGAGPGNFRQLYLKYKLPGASEEIIDPHNLFLGIWAGGGLLALIGLLLFIAVVMKNGLKPTAETGSAVLPQAVSMRDLITSQILPIATVLGVLYLIEGSFEVVLLGVGGVSILFAVFFATNIHQRDILPASILAASVAIIVHLLAASGIEMPAIVMMLFLFAMLGEDQSEPPLLSTTLDNRRLLGVAGLMTVLALGCVKTALVPVRLAAISIQTGNYRLISEGNTQLAKRDFEEAATADPLSPEPPQQLAMLNYRLWDQSNRRRTEFFEQAVEELEQSIRLDPTAVARIRLLGNLWDQRFKQTQNVEHGQRAVETYRQAVALYPNFSALQAEYAIALDRLNEDATSVAQFALELDDLNRTNQHTDKVLADEIRSQLEAIVNSTR